MPDTFTDNYQFVLPEIGGSDNTWGQKLHDNYNKFDALLHQPRRNLFINGGFNIWQRGTSGADGFIADRWGCLAWGGATVAQSRQLFSNDAMLPGNPSAYYRNTFSGASGMSGIQLYQCIENVHTLAGRQGILSFWAKADAPIAVGIDLFQQYNSSDTAYLGVDTHIVLTTEWARYELPINPPPIPAGTSLDNTSNLKVVFWLSDGGGYADRTDELPQQSGIFDLAMVQLEAGSIATLFEQRHVAEELALCQRYYELGTERGLMCSFTIYSGRSYRLGTRFMTQKRVPPAVVFENTSSVSFPTIANIFANVDGFFVVAQAVDSAESAYIRGNWAADAEL